MELLGHNTKRFVIYFQQMSPKLSEYDGFIIHHLLELMAGIMRLNLVMLASRSFAAYRMVFEGFFRMARGRPFSYLVR